MTLPPNTTSPTHFEKTFCTKGYNLPTNSILELTVFSSVDITNQWDAEWNDFGIVASPTTP